MKKLLLIPILLLAFSAHAQQKQNLTAQSTVCQTAASCLAVPVLQYQGGATFTLTGTFSGTVQFEASGDGGTTWVALNVTPSNSSTAVSSATTAGTWQANVVGYTNVRERVSTYSSGTVVASIVVSTVSARGGSGGGGAPVSLTATSPIVVAPSPTTGTGVISCPTCTTSAPTLNQVLNPTADKTFAMPDSIVSFKNTGAAFNYDGELELAPNVSTFKITYGPDALGESAGIVFNSTVGSLATKWSIISNEAFDDLHSFSLSDNSGSHKWYMKQGATGAIYFQQSGGNVGIGVDPAGSPASKLEVVGTTTSTGYATTTNCANGATPAVCAAAASGAVAIPTGVNPTLVVNTSAVTASSRIFLAIDESLTIAATTCNTTLSTLVQPVVTARSAGVSFTIQIGSTLATNPACVSYFLVN